MRQTACPGTHRPSPRGYLMAIASATILLTLFGCPTLSRGAALPAQAAATLGQYSIAEDAGSLRVMGFVVNTGDLPATQVHITVTLLNAAGTALATVAVTDLRDTIPAHQRSPFLAVFPSMPASWVSERIDVTAQMPPAVSRNQLNNLSTEHEGFTPSSGVGVPFTVTGQVHNGGSVSAPNAEVIGIAYDTQGNTLDVNAVELHQALAPGASAPFTLHLDARGQRLGRYGLYVQGIL